FDRHVPADHFDVDVGPERLHLDVAADRFQPQRAFHAAHLHVGADAADVDRTAGGHPDHEVTRDVATMPVGANVDDDGVAIALEDQFLDVGAEIGLHLDFVARPALHLHGAGRVVDRDHAAGRRL